VTKRAAKVIALQQAYAAVNKALGVADDSGRSDEDQIKVDNALDGIAQGLFNRWKRAEERLGRKQ
jgi:hypothetical protein